MGDQDFGHEPPDDKGGSSFVQEKVSFCDKVFHNKEKPPVRPKVNSLKHNLATIEYENSNPLKPMVHIADSMFEGLCTSWQNALVVKLLGKRIGYNMMKDCLTCVWKLKAGFDMVDGWIVIERDGFSATKLEN